MKSLALGRNYYLEFNSGYKSVKLTHYIMRINEGENGFNELTLYGFKVTLPDSTQLQLVSDTRFYETIDDVKTGTHVGVSLDHVLGVINNFRLKWYWDQVAHLAKPWNFMKEVQEFVIDEDHNIKITKGSRIPDQLYTSSEEAYNWNTVVYMDETGDLLTSRGKFESLKLSEKQVELVNKLNDIFEELLEYDVDIYYQNNQFYAANNPGNISAITFISGHEDSDIVDVNRLHPIGMKKNFNDVNDGESKFALIFKNKN